MKTIIRISGVVSWCIVALILIISSCTKENNQEPIPSIVVPSVSTNTITSVTPNSAIGGGTINNTGNGNIIARGLVWSTNPGPTVSLTTKTINGAFGDSFSSEIKNLISLTKYYVRAYATNAAGTGYGDELTFTTTSEITAPPASLGLHSFYKKYLDASGIPIISSAKVPDMALYNVRNTLNHMLTAIPNVVPFLIRNKLRVGIKAVTEVTTDLPEHSDLYKAFPGRDWNKDRGLGATIERPLCSVAEENVLCYGIGRDPYYSSDILVHEIAHGIYFLGLKFTILDIDDQLTKVYNNAKTKNLWANTYAITNKDEYFAEGTMDWFNVNAEAIPADGIHNQINTREELRTYDESLYLFLKRFFTENNQKVSCHQ